MEDLQIFDCGSPGFTALAENEKWVVGIVNYMDRLDPNGLIKRERHMETDEMFIPVLGESSLHMGEEMVRHPMEIGKAYLVKKGVWHAVSLSPDAKVFIVENPATGLHNTELFFFDK